MLRYPHFLSSSVNILAKVRRFSSAPNAFSYNRKVLIPNFPLKKAPGKTISIEVAEYSDVKMIENFCVEAFLQHEPILKYLEIDRDTFVNEILDGMSRQCLRFPYSIVAMDGDKMAGYYLGFVEIIDENSVPSPMGVKDFGLLHDHYVNKYQIKKRNAAVCSTVVNYCLGMIGHFVPRDNGRVLMGHGEHAAVAKEYSGNNILQTMLISAAREMRADGFVKMLCGITTGNVSTANMLELGYSLVWEIPYRDFKIHGEPVFGDGVLHDGGSKISLFLADVDAVADRELPK
ncbi:unnamed protein product [Bursaphelenchus xylophilus]|uniref:(pine wood nematode) hypothetical protein n=1 Tax=Bursaphelenchus xylophilus TaxID=6326 RepID=A0A1I7RUS5_BURXY|nr:unnamed protein product [Bursaphelenchus xylophilus]CAG9105508.1 unnamed protein product [Bursaphelenchus xylophilus]